MIGGTALVTTPSGQYSQQVKHAGLFRLAGMHFLRSMIGRSTLQEPVRPASPGPDSLWDFRQPNFSSFILRLQNTRLFIGGLRGRSVFLRTLARKFFFDGRG